MNFNFKTLGEVPLARGTRVLLTSDLNVPLVDGEVADAYRITRARRTLDFLRERGARTLLVSHRSDTSETLRPVFAYLKKELPIVFADTLAEAQALLTEAPEGSFVLLENIRRFPGEIENSEAFARDLASLAEVYVNEAFSASHRAHASIIGVPRILPHYAGFLFAEEVAHLSRAFTPPHPALVIIGGAKFETKLPLVKKFLDIADSVFICGALANDVFKARGDEVGRSLTSSVPIPEEIVRHLKLRVPPDVVRVGERIVDAGAESIAELGTLIRAARFVLWNGPLGEYQSGRYESTEAVARMIAESKAESIIGGGDTLAVVSRLGLLERFSFVSTGGGAMLQFLADGTLQGLEALR